MENIQNYSTAQAYKKSLENLQMRQLKETDINI